MFVHNICVAFISLLNALGFPKLAYDSVGVLFFDSVLYFGLVNHIYFPNLTCRVYHLQFYWGIKLTHINFRDWYTLNYVAD